MSKRGKAHLCLTCEHANWRRKAGQLMEVGFCEAPDPALPSLPAVKWWTAPASLGVLGGDIYRKTKHPVGACEFYRKGTR